MALPRGHSSSVGRMGRATVSLCLVAVCLVWPHQSGVRARPPEVGHPSPASVAGYARGFGRVSSSSCRGSRIGVRSSRRAVEDQSSGGAVSSDRSKAPPGELPPGGNP